jgi:hypothetical protein
VINQAPAAVYGPAPVINQAPAAVYGPAPVFNQVPTAVYRPAPVINQVPTTAVYGPAPVINQVPTAVYGPSVRMPSQVVVAGPSVPVRTTAVARQQGVNQQLASDVEYYKRLGEKQAREHRENSREVSDASQDLSRITLINRVVAGSGNAADWFVPARLIQQKRVVEAYRSEKQIANKNAQDAYQRYQKDPSRLNLLVSKYQDLNADLRESAFDFNVINSATFGQKIAASTGLFGNVGGNLFGTLTQVITQRKQSEELRDIQRDMQRVARQIQQEARGAVSGAQAALSGAQAGQLQGSVQQRLMASTVYGPQRG